MTRDAIIVGAGLAGLAAADVLHRQGRDVLVLEARDRVGGRTFSPVHAGYRFDLGGQWLDQKHTQMRALVDRFGLQTYPQHRHGRNVMDLRGEVRRFRRVLPPLGVRDSLAVAAAFVHLTGLAWRDGSVDGGGSRAGQLRVRAHDERSVADYIETVGGSDAARSVLRIAVQMVMAEEPERLSFAAFLSYIQRGGGLRRLLEVHDGAQDLRVVGGTQQIAEHLAAGLQDRLVTGMPVERLAVQDEAIAVHTSETVHHGRRVILALPGPVLAGLERTPAWPARRAALHEAMFMGDAFKFVLVFERAYWRDHGLSGETVSDTRLIRATFDNTPPSGPASLVAFGIGDGSRALRARSTSERVAYLRAHLAHVFGVPTPHLVDVAELDWHGEPESLGGYTGLLGPGDHTRFGDALARPIGRLHFAGTETAGAFCGYMEGAVRSGLRAAAEVAAALG